MYINKLTAVFNQIKQVIVLSVENSSEFKCVVGNLKAECIYEREYKRC